MKILTKSLIAAASLLLLVSPVEAKKKKKTPAEPPKSAYCQFTGRDSVEMKGVMNVVAKGDTMFLELPAKLLGRQFLVVNKLQQVPAELNESGVNKGINYQNQTIRFEWNRKDKKLVVRQQRVTPKVNPQDAMALSVAENYIDPVLAVLPVRCVGPDSSTVIFPVSNLFNGKEDCLNDVFHNINISNSPKTDLCRLLSLKAHEESVTAMSELTAVVHEGMSRVNVTVVVSSAILLLPEVPMEGREESARVGYFADRQLEFSDTQTRTKHRSYINRWRLEPKDKAAYMRGELTEPIKPITFYIDRRIPGYMHDGIRQGILDWNEAFEKAGFRNAVRVIEMTDSMEREEDDMKYSVVTYAASEKANAMGPCVTDPRSGEILEADIIWWHNVRRLLAQWLTVQTGAVNPAVRQPNLPDALLADAARFVACHEVGHSLGLRHNMRASAAYPTDSLRNAAFMNRVGGTSASIMDYARYNYVAQPGDDVTVLSPHIGPYDLFAIEWGYRWYPSEAEAKPQLARLIAEHTGNEYKYSETQSYRSALDPRSLSEDLGDDGIKSARYGIANLKRIVPCIAEWTRTGEADQSWDDAASLWQSVIGQWDLYIYHVLSNVGGMYLENTVVGDGQQTFTYVPAQKQRDAVKFLIDEVLTTPEWLFCNDLAKRTYLLKNGREEHPLTSLKNEQNFIIWDLLTNDRIVRMMQNEADQGPQLAYTANEMMQTLYKALFLDRQNPDLMQRTVQKSFVDALITAAATNEGIKVNKSLYEERERIGCCDYLTDLCTAGNALSSRPRDISFSSTQMNRNSDAISVKRAILLRIRQFAKQRAGNLQTVQQMHYADMVQRIELALGMK